jgi:predicted murein hydrolase (TIGR00659 family)
MLVLDPSAWTGLLSQPGLIVGLTVLAYVAATRLSRWSGGHALLNPTLVTILLVASGLKLAGISYETYAQGASVIAFFLAPAVVLLAVPLYRRTAVIRASGRLIAGALAVGLPVGALSGVAIAWLLGGTRQTILSLAPRSTTAGIAIGISERIGGIPALTAVLVIATGITGAILGPALARGFGIRDERVIGLAMGISGHGIATARALQIGEVAGAFAGLGMSLNGVLTAVLLPAIVTLS